MLYPIHSVSLNFYIRSSFFVNGPYALYVNLGCLKCISSIIYIKPRKAYLLYHLKFLLLNRRTDYFLAFSINFMNILREYNNHFWSLKGFSILNY